MAYYDHIAKRWNLITGASGGAFKKFVLNQVLLELMPDLSGLSILELGAGNGYFARFLLERRKGQRPILFTVTDLSSELISIAEQSHRARGARYAVLDAGAPLPFKHAMFDLVLATMLFSEMSDRALVSALREISRVLVAGGRLLATVVHPTFARSLDRRGQLRPERGLMTMPGQDGLRLPIVAREAAEYERVFRSNGFDWAAQDVRPDHRVLAEKPGLKLAGKIPLALVMIGRKLASA